MNRLNQILLTLHFVGLAMGFSASFANMAAGGLIAKAAPAERPVLGRFPPVMSAIGRLGLGLLWITGLILTYSKYGGFEALPLSFFLKTVVVVLLTIAIAYIYSLERQAYRGDAAAGARIPTAGKVATSLALLSVLFAVVTFD